MSRQARIVRVRQSTQLITEEFYRDKEFSVAIGFTMLYVATEVLVSRQSVGLGWRGARVRARGACVLCTRQICDSALFGSLFTNTVHGHCLKKKVQKRPPGIWGVTEEALL